MTDLLATLHQDHKNISQLLQLLEQQVHAMHADKDIVDFRLMQDIIDYFISYPDVVHHPLEDVLFVRMVALDLTLLDVVKELREQHKQQARIGQDLTRRNGAASP